MRTTWHFSHLMTHATHWLSSVHKRTRQHASENSLWWSFIFAWPTCIATWLRDFQRGAYQFSPMTQYHFSDETVRFWSYKDRLMIKLILSIIKPTFKHLISSRCYHMQGPGGVKVAIRHISNCLQNKSFAYVIRADIKGYYASISRDILSTQLRQHYQDPRLQHYFDQIVNCAIDKNANIFVPTTGIPRRSSLSPFFGALYLSPLDNALTARKGIQYFRYMDDILILTQTPRQYRRAKKILFETLAALKLTLSAAKTRMGAIQHGFHFLGVQFEASQNPQSKNQAIMRIHNRSCARALDRVNAMREDAVHPAKMQRYLIRWGTWWSDTIPSLSLLSILQAWVILTAAREPAAVWIGRGLLLPWPSFA